ncbi:MAG: hypothetical protein E7641_07225 [Ruminococcaceae bacterium]|nr:hypothetical protein [Oscillospiraceae bacterium]
MKKAKKIIALTALICAAGILLCSCGKGNKFSFNKNGLVDKKTDVTYIDAPDCYSPIAVSEEVYGHLDDYRFYEIIGISPSRFVAEADGTVFYASNISLPDIDELQVSYMDICTETTTLKVNKTVEAGEDIKAIIGGYLSEENIYYPNLTPETMYEIRFADTSLGLYYTLTFIRYASDYGEQGRDFLYNRSANRFVKAPDVLVRYIDELSA